VIDANQAGGTCSYGAASQVQQSIQVTKATLTVTANNATKLVNTANPAFTASYSGFVSPDNSSVVSGAPSFTTTATTSSPACTYPIVPALGTLSAANYTFTPFVNGTLTVSVSSVVLTTTATVTGSAAGGYSATVTVTNTGTVNAVGAVLKLATLNGFATTTLLPHSLGTIPANGGTATVTVAFSGTDGGDTTSAVEEYAGTYTGGTFSGGIRVVLP
jgi:hypothetical protein